MGKNWFSNTAVKTIAERLMMLKMFSHPKNKGNWIRRISRKLCAEMPQNFGLMADGQSSMDQGVKALNCVFTAAARPALWAPSPGREGTAWKRH